MLPFPFLRNKWRPVGLSTSVICETVGPRKKTRKSKVKRQKHKLQNNACKEPRAPLLKRNTLDSQMWLRLSHSKNKLKQSAGTPSATPDSFRFGNSVGGPRNPFYFFKFSQVWGRCGLGGLKCPIRALRFTTKTSAQPLTWLLSGDGQDCLGSLPILGTHHVGSSPAWIQGQLLPGPRFNYSSKIICKLYRIFNQLL